MKLLSPERRLQGRTIFLSGSVPQSGRGFERVRDTAFVVEQAVVALARAVLAEGGRIVFGAHPSISPLVAAVAAEYRLANSSENLRSVVIYQSRAFEALLPDATWEMFRYGFADLVWTQAKGGESFVKGEPASFKCPLSLTEMRTRMIREQQPTAMVIVGGMEGVVEELDLFQLCADGSPVFAARETGGAAAYLLREKGRSAMTSIEDDWLQAGGGGWQLEAGGDPREVSVPPYGAMMQWLVGKLGDEAARV